MQEMKILDVSKVGGNTIRLNDYTHILAYHATRAEDEQMFRTQGLKPYTKEEALADAVRKLECERASRKRIETVFNSYWDEIEYPQSAGVCLMLEGTELLNESSHYLIYGSEFMNALALQLGCRERLTKIGKPMLVVCAVPIADISQCWLSDLEQRVKNKDTAGYTISAHTVAPENIIDIHYPTGYVRDPYSWMQVKLS